MDSSGAANNSLWELDPLASGSHGGPANGQGGGADNSLWQMDPLAHNSCESDAEFSLTNQSESRQHVPVDAGDESDEGSAVTSQTNILSSPAAVETETHNQLTATDIFHQVNPDSNGLYSNNSSGDMPSPVQQRGLSVDSPSQETKSGQMEPNTSMSPSAATEPEAANSESPASNSSHTPSSLYVTACESHTSPSESIRSPLSCGTSDILKPSSAETVKLSSQMFQTQSRDKSVNIPTDAESTLIMASESTISPTSDLETNASSTLAMETPIPSGNRQDDSLALTDTSCSGNCQTIIAKLHEEIRQKNGDLHLAGEFGNQLITKNSQLQDQLEALMKDHSRKVEELEQERYSMQLKLDQRAKMETNYVDEIDNLKSALRRQTQEHEEFLEAEQNSKVSELRSQLLAQQTELEQSQMSCRQLGTEKDQLETLLREARDQLEQKINMMNETCSEEMAGLHAEINALQNDKIALSRDLNSARNLEEQYQLRSEHLQSQLVAKEQEVEERQVQATSYYNALEREREAVQDLKVQLEVARMESQNMRTKGNSLFSEVEDRRVVAEKELISLKVKLDTLSKQLKITKQNEHTLKHQLSILLQKAGHTADVEHMQRLQEQLSVARSEITTLTQQLQHRDKQPQKKNAKEEMYDAWYKQMSAEDPNRMVFFENLLKTKEKELEAIQAELKTKRMMLLAEDQKVLRYESQLYDTQRQLEKQRDANIKLKLKIDELRMKYEPERHTGGSVMKGIVEKIPSPKCKQNTGKENQPVEIKDVWPEENTDNKSAPENSKTAVKDISNSKTSIGAQRKLSGDTHRSLPKPLSATTKPVIKSLPRKQVKIAEDVVVIKSSCDECLPADTPSKTSSQSEESSQVDQVKPVQRVEGRVKGQQRQRKVKVVGEDDAACAQQ